MRVCLERNKSTSSQTLGNLYVYNQLGKLLLACHTMELPWRDNERRVSCIPTGAYKVVKHQSPKFGESFWVKDVPDRSEILIHKGNFNRDTLGCILPGMGLADIDYDGHLDVVNSTMAMAELYYLLPDEFELEISDR